MRILKKFIKKLYHLIWFLSIFLLFVPNAYAEPSISNFSINSNSLQPNGYISGTSSANKLRFDVQSDGTITYIRNIFCFDSRVTSWYTNLPTTQLYDVIFYSTNQKCNYYGSNYTGHVMYFYATYEPINNPSASLVMTFDTSAYFSIGLINYSVSHTPFNYVFSQPDEGAQVTIDTNGIINSQNQSSQNIINNQDSNTQDIINNQDSNTQDIIDNQNQNSQNEIESQKSCRNVKYNLTLDTAGNSKNFYLNSSNTLIPVPVGSGFDVSNYYHISSKTSIFAQSSNALNAAAICFYDKDKTLLSCETWNRRQSIEITPPTNTDYFRTTISTGLVTVTGSYCGNGNQVITDSIDNLNDTLNDNSVDSSDDTLNNLKNQIPTNSVISDLLLLPIRFLQNFVNALNSSCSSFSLGSLLGTNLVMPCINLENYLGSTIWTMIDLIFSGMFVYSLRKKFIEIYENITNLKNGGNEVD